MYSLIYIFCKRSAFSYTCITCTLKKIIQYFNMIIHIRVGQQALYLGYINPLRTVACMHIPWIDVIFM